MKRLLCLLLCLMMIAPMAAAESTASTVHMADLLRYVAQLTQGATIGLELPGEERAAITLDPDREDFARIDLPGGTLLANQEGLFLKEASRVSGVTWAELMKAASGLEMAQLPDMGQTLAADVQTLLQSLGDELMQRMPVFVTGEEEDGFVSASIRVDATGLLNTVYSVMEEEAGAIDRILQTVGRLTGTALPSADALLARLQRALRRMGLDNPGEVLSGSFGFSNAGGESTMTLLATIGPAKLSMTLENGRLSGTLYHGMNEPLLTITGTAAIGDGAHMNLVIEDATGSFTPIHLHLALNGDGFSGMITGESFSLSEGFGENTGLHVSLRAGSQSRLRPSWAFDLTMSDDGAAHLNASTPYGSLRGAYRMESTWVEDDSRRWGGYYIYHPALELEASGRSWQAMLDYNQDDGMSFSFKYANATLAALRLAADLNAFSLRLGSTQLLFNDMPSPNPDEGLIRLHVQSPGFAQDYTLRLYVRNSEECIDLLGPDGLLATIVLDDNATYLPPITIGAYAALDAEAMLEAIEAFLLTAEELLPGEAPATEAPVTEAPVPTEEVASAP